MKSFPYNDEGYWEEISSYSTPSEPKKQSSRDRISARLMIPGPNLTMRVS